MSFRDELKMEYAVFNKILDGMKANLYVTDLDTDEIIFMNETMKKDFQLSHPEGQICWMVLQKGQSGRCEFCPVPRLTLTHKTERNYVYQWDECNPVTKRFYRNFDSLILWMDGRTVHLQQSVDVTELKSANTDELTQFYIRRYGKEVLRETLKLANQNGRTLTICLYDINLLKEVNDSLGHALGDQLIIAISDAVRDELNEEEFAFRLSGDEFVVVFTTGQRESAFRMERVLKQIKFPETPDEKSFCYGLAEAVPGKQMSADELLFLADKRMYEQKRQFHIRWMEKHLKWGGRQYRTTEFHYASEKLYDALVESTDSYLYVCNMKTGIFKYPKAMVEEFALPGEVIENAAAIWGEKVHKDDKAAFLESNQEIADGRSTSHCVEYRVVNRHGEWVWVRCRGHLELDENGEPLLFAGFIKNLGERDRIDGLTGLFNKLEFQNQIEHLLASKQAFSVMILGIDDLKHINDLYNRIFGDEVIRITSKRLHSLLQGGWILYRLDGDEFGVIAMDADRAAMEKFYRRVSHSFEKQQTLDEKKFYGTLSAGCLFCPEDAIQYEDAVKYSEYCLEYSKKHGKKQCTFYSSSILDQRSKSLAMVELLRESVEDNFAGFSLYYQPLVKAETGELMGAEALARWENERFGMVSPMEFIPLLEITGLIVPVGKWILNTALETSKKWIEKKKDFVIDVNLSYVQILESDFLFDLKGTMERTRFSSDNLVLELTESYFIGESTRVKDIFREIREMGIRVAMDDFGTGYSTLGILKESPADIVKIDKTFIRDINTSNFDATFIRFVVELCHGAGIQVCQEGVENRETYELVSSMGLDLIQGYLFDRPLPESIFMEKYFSGL